MCCAPVERGPRRRSKSVKKYGLIGPPYHICATPVKKSAQHFFLKVLKHLPQTLYCVRVQFQQLLSSRFACRRSTSQKTTKKRKIRLVSDLKILDYGGYTGPIFAQIVKNVRKNLRFCVFSTIGAPSAYGVQPGTAPGGT